MEIRFIKVDPTQNMTILVDTSVPRELHARVAAALMDYNSVNAEQVGFLERPSSPDAFVRLQMMGGEFCGNASMSCASWLAFRNQMPENIQHTIPIEVSGANELVKCVLTREGNSCIASVSMPLPQDIRTIHFSNGIVCPVVFFPGIAHAILPEAVGEDISIIAQMCAELETEALGLIRVDSTKDSIRPLVYVRDAGSAVYERGCGSGTAAVIALKAVQSSSSVKADIDQPGGTITAEAVFEHNKVSSIIITGKVNICAVGTAYIDLD